MVDLTGKCVEGMQMNWANYLINELEKDFCISQDLGYEFHYIWLIILIAFVDFQMLEGATFLDIEPTKPLATHFSTLWCTNDMTKQWKSNVVFHEYYQKLKVSIESFPRMRPRNLHQYRPIAEIHTDPHFIYITM
jgi:hypothetical protein